MSQPGDDLLNQVVIEPVHEEAGSLEQGGILEGRWLPDEHDRFLVGIMQFGKDWKEVQQVVKTRTGSQVRSHAQKYFIKLNKIRKERKKQKSKLPTEPTEIENEVISRFTEEDICDKTPQEFIFLIKESRDGMSNAQGYSDKLHLKKSDAKLEHKKSGSKSEIQQTLKEGRDRNNFLNPHQNSEGNQAKGFDEKFEAILHSYGQSNESYFSEITKSAGVENLKDFIISCIDFGGQKNSNSTLQINANNSPANQGRFNPFIGQFLMVPEQFQTTAIRKRSFALFQEPQDSNRLKQTLEKVRKGGEKQ